MRGLHRMLEFASAREQNNFKGSSLFSRDIAAPEHALSTRFHGNVVQCRQVLPREREKGGTFSPLKSRRERACRFLGIGWTDYIEIRYGPKGRHGFDRLVGRAIFADTDRVMRENVDDWQFRKCGEANGGTALIAEYQKRRAAGPENRVVGNAVENAAHGMLADAEAKVAAFAVLGIEIPAFVDVVERRTMQIGAA